MNECKTHFSVLTADLTNGALETEGRMVLKQDDGDPTRTLLQSLMKAKLVRKER